MTGSTGDNTPNPRSNDPFDIPPGGSTDPVRHDGIGPTDFSGAPSQYEPQAPPQFGTSSQFDSGNDATRTFAAARDDDATQAYGAAPAYDAPTSPYEPPTAHDPNDPYGPAAPYDDIEHTQALPSQVGDHRPERVERPEDRFITGTTTGDATPVVVVEDEGVAKRGFHIPVLGGWLLGIVRILIGWQFLWAFADKTFGLGFSTSSDNAWVSGGRPTEGFLAGVVNDPNNPFSELFETFYGEVWADWLFMIGLLGIGIVLILGLGKILTWFASVCAIVMYLLMYLAAWPAGHGRSSGAEAVAANPFLDSHLLNAFVILALAVCNAGAYLGLAKAWRSRRAFKDA